MDTKNLFFQQPTGSYSAGTKVPADFNQAYLAELVQRGAVIEVLPVDVEALKAETRPPVDESRWRYTAEDLDGMDLETLNMFVIDHAERYNREVPEPFTSIEAAVKFLGSEI